MNKFDTINISSARNKIINLTRLLDGSILYLFHLELRHFIRIPRIKLNSHGIAKINRLNEEDNVGLN